MFVKFPVQHYMQFIFLCHSMKFYNNLYTTEDHESSFVYWQKDDISNCSLTKFIPKLMSPDSPNETNGISVKLNGIYWVSVYKTRFYEKQQVDI